MKFIDWTGEINDFSDTAALVSCLDLVIAPPLRTCVCGEPTRDQRLRHELFMISPYLYRDLRSF